MGRAFEVRKASMMKTGMAKAKIYTRHSKEIYLAAKSGVANPDSNLTLKRLIEKAKKDQVPADVIKRALDKVSSGTGEDYKANRYEGFGPEMQQNITFKLDRVMCEEKNVYPEIGDIIFFDTSYYEIDNTNEIQFIGGSPDNNFSIVCETFMVTKSNLNIEERIK